MFYQVKGLNMRNPLLSTYPSLEDKKENGREVNTCVFFPMALSYHANPEAR